MRGRTAALTILLLAAAAGRGQAQSSAPVEARSGPWQVALTADERDSLRAVVKSHLTYLTRPELAGRATGQPGSDSAAEYLASRYQAMQIAPASPARVCTSLGACGTSYFQTFGLPAMLETIGFADNVRARNVIAAIPGTDPALANEWLVIGGHYDHVGTTGLGSNDLDYPTRPHLGADDNASGTAAVMALARRLADIPVRRPVMFVNFGAEELGLVGSRFFVGAPPIPVNSIVAMFNFDMVGRLRSRPLDVIGVGSSTDWVPLLDSARVATRMRYTPTALVGAGSDHQSFAEAGVPVLFFHTGLHVDWHTRRDTIGKIDIDGIVRVLDFAERVIRAVGDRDAPVARQ
jgi:hypothetical protein